MGGLPFQNRARCLPLHSLLLPQPHLVVAETPPDQAKSQELRHPYRPGNVCRRHRRPRVAILGVSPVFLGCRRDGYLRGLRDCRRIVREPLRIGTVALLRGLVHRLHLDPLRARADPAEEQGAPVLPQTRLLQAPWASRWLASEDGEERIETRGK